MGAEEAQAGVEPAEPAAPVEPVAPVVVRKPVVAMRGDDRPGMKKETPAVPGRGGKFGDRKDGPRTGGRDGGRDARPGARPDDRGPRRDSWSDRPPMGDRFDAPRLGDAAFRAQRDALDQAQFALRKLAAQAHGEALTHVLTAWEQRDAAQVPGVQELGNRVSPAVRTAWVKAIDQAPTGDASNALLRLEMAAEVPTPAEHLSDRRMMQLQLLTKRNDPAPAQTWGQDAAAVLAAAFEPAQARRLQNVMKVLLKP